MKIFFNGVETHDIKTSDSSYRYRTIMGENALTVFFSATEYIEIPVGSYTEFQGETYTLRTHENFKKRGPRSFDYMLIMESPSALLRKYKFRDNTSMRLKFANTAKPHEHLEMLVANLNMRDSGWSVGDCITATEKPISFNHNFCSEALQMMAEAFETEWEINNKTISLRKIEYNKESPLPLSYGRGNGFKPGVGRTNVDNMRPIEILFVQGGSRNIDKSKYGSTELLLPKNQQMTYQGRTYVVDSMGLSIRRADKPQTTFEEDSIDLSNIYPHRIGVISQVLAIDPVAHKYDFTDESIPPTLDFEEALTAGQKMTVIFYTGQLAGREFNVKFEKTDRVLPPNRFEIAAQEVDGYRMPGPGFLPVPGDKYGVFGITLPEVYIRDDSQQLGASWEMFREACEYLYNNEEQRFNFEGELDGIWAKANWSTVGPKIKLGGIVQFSDPQFLINGVLTRITGIKDFINDPHSPIIDLSTLVTKGNIKSDLQAIYSNEVTTEELNRENLDLHRRWYDYIIDFQDDRFRANEVFKDESLDPRMLAYDSGTVQFSIKDGVVTTNYMGDPNRVHVSSGTFYNHHYHAEDRDKIEEHRILGEPYIPQREWDLISIDETLQNDLGHFIYIKVPVDQ